MPPGCSYLTCCIVLSDIGQNSRAVLAGCQLVYTEQILLNRANREALLSSVNTLMVNQGRASNGRCDNGAQSRNPAVFSMSAMAAITGAIVTMTGGGLVPRVIMVPSPVQQDLCGSTSYLVTIQRLAVITNTYSMCLVLLLG